MDVAEFFDVAYGATGRYWWKVPQRYAVNPDDHPASLMTQFILRYVAGRMPGRALDLGSGEGADAIRLALMGWTVDAVEISAVGAEKIRRFARDAGADVNVFDADASTYESSVAYDLVICNGLLHYVRDKARLVRRMQNMTAPGGCNAVSAWSTFSPVPECHRLVPTFPDDEDGVITDAYRDWEKTLLYCERERLESAHGEMERHVHSFIKLVAVKPGG